VGSVIEAKLDRGRGAVATVLVQDGTLRLNDSYIVGNTFGKVRAMFDDRGRAIEEAGPSTPSKSSASNPCPTPATHSWSLPIATRPRALRNTAR
jgi:translation initiation factor IF-2